MERNFFALYVMTLLAITVVTAILFSSHLINNVNISQTKIGISLVLEAILAFTGIIAVALY